jgi:hypothetical protein
MELNQLNREADELIRKVVTRYNSLYAHPGNLPQVELDLLLDELRMLYDKFKMISQENMSRQAQPAVEMAPPVSEKPAEPATKPADEAAPPPTAPPAPGQVEDEKPVARIVHTLPAEEEPDTETEEEIPEEDVAEKEEIPLEKPVPPRAAASPTQPATSAGTLADRFQATGKSIGEQISREESSGTPLTAPRIGDLKSAIGLYEKFNFINELFNGDALAYERAIVQLNGMVTFKDAMNYLGSLSGQFGWPAESEAAARLKELLQRKFD